jgi:hypothetical protein
MVSLTIEGDSWAKGGPGALDGTRFWDRVASRNRMIVAANRGISGSRSYGILASIQSNWTPNSIGMVGLGDIVINDVRNYADDHGRTTSREVFRAMLDHLSAWAVETSSSASLIYGPGWTAGLSDGTAGRTSTSPGRATPAPSG